MQGRLKKGAGTHLASWLQEVDNISIQQAASWLIVPSHPKTASMLQKFKQMHGKTLGHSNSIVDADFSGELMATKDEKSMRLWRATDGTLLRVMSACVGDRVRFSETGQNIVTGFGGTNKVKIWGPAGGSAVGCGKTKITAGKN